MKRRALMLGALVAALMVCGACVNVTVAAARAQTDATANADDEARGKAWWAHIQVLADDSMRGRQTGSQDYMRAAAYVVKQFKAFGLAPAGVGGSYFQPVHFVEQWVNAGKSSMNLVVDGRRSRLRWGRMRCLDHMGPNRNRWMQGWCLSDTGCICRSRAMTISIRQRCRRLR
jgi:hypothetical protein